MAADGTITFSTALDNEQLEKDLKAAEREVESIKRKIERAESGKTAIEAEMERGEEAIHQTEQAIRDLKARLEELNDTDPTDATAWFTAQGQIAGVRGRIEEANGELAKQIKEQDRLNDRWQKLDTDARGYAAQLEQATQRQKELGDEYASTWTKAGASVSTSLDGARARLDAFSRKLNTMLKRVFVFGIMLKALNALKDAIGAALMENEQLSASFENLKATVNGFVAGLVQVAIPAITATVNAASAAITALAGAIDGIFGTNIVAAIQQARAKAEAAWRETEESKKAAKALEKQKDATKDLEKAQKEATRTIMAFDEINALQADNSDDAADALADEAGAIDPSSLMRPDWDAFDVGKISEKLAAIMLILGAALMAVGAVLCFSGINIPLGITLMVIGALMIYAVYKENWDKLPEEVRKAITGMLVFSGITLIVIGAILALSGANIPLGVGMMVAGALLLWTAVALNWESMPESIRNVVTAIMVALSLGLMAVGAVLCFSGANIPLGIALMILGAISLATVAAINWERMPEQIRTVVTAIMLIMGGAMLVIGAILALSGANVPLGVGLMIAGAILLAAPAVLNWESLPEQMQVTVSIIAALLATAFIVIGAILTFSGANLPLGIALIGIGALALAADAVLNWELITENIDTVIAGIMAVVGVAFLVLGAVLTFSGANPPLGIALLILGALDLVSVVVLNWEKIPLEVQNAVLTISAFVSVAFLVLGAVLTFSGANIPLGLALLVAGVVTLVFAIAPNWDKIPSETRNVISVMMGIIGAALIVIGVILCVTGVGLPFGIACIMAGIGSFVAAIALNWNFILEKCQEMWGNITRWFQGNVAPIFTPGWWASKFQSIVAGMTSPIRSAISTFASFVNSIISGVARALSSLGSAQSHARSVSVPHLAQGAVIPPNREFMAVLGDQKSGNNIEAPEALIRKVVREEAGSLVVDAIRAMRMEEPQQQQEGGGDVTLVLQVGYEELARAVSKGNASLVRRGEFNTSVSFA